MQPKVANNEIAFLSLIHIEISPHGGLVKTFEKPHVIEPALDRVIFREELRSRIAALIGGL